MRSDDVTQRFDRLLAAMARDEKKPQPERPKPTPKRKPKKEKPAD